MSDSRQIKFTEAQARYLEQHVQLPSELRAIMGSPVQRTPVLTRDQKNGLLEVLGAELQRRGFDPSYEPTEEGRTLEGIIDTLTSATP